MTNMTNTIDINDSDIVKAAIDRVKFVVKDLNFIPYDKLTVDVSETRVVWSIKIGNHGTKALVESSVYGVIMDKDFLKGFFGEDICCSGCGIKRGEVTFPECMKSNRVSHDRDGISWRYHGFQMFCSDDPIAYLKTHLLFAPISP